MVGPFGRVCRAGGCRPGASRVIPVRPRRYLDMNHSQRSRFPVRQTTTLEIAGMSCGACVRHITRALDGMTGVISLEVDLQQGAAVVEHLVEWTDERAMVAAIKDAGYPARVIARETTGDAGQPSGSTPEPV